MGSDGVDISESSKDKKGMKSIKLPRLSAGSGSGSGSSSLAYGASALGAGLGLLSTLPALIKAETLGLTLSFAKTPEEHHIVSLARRIKATTLFIDTFARQSLEFVSTTMRAALVDTPSRWTTAFSNVIYLNSTPPSEALSAFRDIITVHISDLLYALATSLRTRILPHLSSLLLTTRSPLLLITHLASLHSPNTPSIPLSNALTYAGNSAIRAPFSAT